jgi:hypothetical protein
MKTYNTCLEKASEVKQVGHYKHHTVGINKHPTTPDRTLGLKAKPATKATLKQLAKINPAIQEKLEAEKLLAKLRRHEAKHGPVQVQPVDPKQADLQAKFEAAQKAKMAALTSVPQYGANVLTAKNCKNSAG